MASRKIETLRKKIKSLGLSALIVPSTDPHQSEYVPPPWQRRGFASDFTGSAGDLVIAEKKAALWTDSRYFLQAERQLAGTDISLCRLGIPGTPSITDWLIETIAPGEKVGIDPHLFSNKIFKKYQKKLAENEIEIVFPDENPVDAIWESRPAFSKSPIAVWPERFSGRSIASKLTALRKKMTTLNAEHHLITTLDAIAWMFNIRGSDVPFNPVVIAYAVVSLGDAHLFVDPAKLTDDVRQYLSENVSLHPYDAFEEFLLHLTETKEKILIDPETCSQWAVNALGCVEQIVFKSSPIPLMKAQKNHVELGGVEAAHLRDGVAMVRFLAWLESTAGHHPLTEMDAAKKLTEFRERGEHYVGPSFGTISAVGANSAIVHYEADEQSDTPLTMDNLYLIDSGAQYLDGTTDITRTVVIGSPSSEQKACFTRVLKGHLGLLTTIFPAGTSGNQLDTIARKPLWDAGLNYGHGTGHGVGVYLNVHEGPYAISHYRGIGVPLKEGMVLSIEPGYYKEDHFGIRTENLVRVAKEERFSTDEAPFLRFVPLTLCPIDRRLIDLSLLNDDERQQLNEYHADVFEKLAPKLSGEALAWLEKATEPLTP